jgi:hypothetical protein
MVSYCARSSSHQTHPSIANAQGSALDTLSIRGPVLPLNISFSRKCALRRFMASSTVNRFIPANICPTTDLQSVSSGLTKMTQRQQRGKAVCIRSRSSCSGGSLPAFGLRAQPLRCGENLLSPHLARSSLGAYAAHSWGSCAQAQRHLKPRAWASCGQPVRQIVASDAARVLGQLLSSAKHTDGKGDRC